MPRDALVVLGDSLTHHDARRLVPADDPVLWPVQVADALGWDLHLAARAGWTCRDAWWALTADPALWAALPRAGAVIVATSTMDSMPSPLPTTVRESIRAIRPAGLRRRVRAGYKAAQPHAARLGRPQALSPGATADHLGRIVTALRAVRPGTPVIATLPATHRSREYGFAHPARARTRRAIEGVAATHGLPLLDLGVTDDHVRSGRGNPDGIHWGPEGHALVADAARALLRPPT